MKNIILSCFDKLAPVIKKHIRGKPPWLTDELKKAMNIRDMLLRKSRKTKSASDISAYKKKRNEVNSLLNKFSLSENLATSRVHGSRYPARKTIQ